MMRERTRSLDRIAYLMTVDSWWGLVGDIWGLGGQRFEEAGETEIDASIVGK